MWTHVLVASLCTTVIVTVVGCALVPHIWRWAYAHPVLYYSAAAVAGAALNCALFAWLES